MMLKVPIFPADDTVKNGGVKACSLRSRVEYVTTKFVVPGVHTYLGVNKNVLV